MNTTARRCWRAEIEYLVFRPYWDVPLNIQRDEIVPNIKDDPNYLSEVHFEVDRPRWANRYQRKSFK